ncbi:hypothetical protein [Vibrio parahaemolyticus]|uniref:hypothetical protein n=1 Tax=Vibrio parahaemolyticus TaxID=670 RepID=UPI00049768D1|nr:hypothetical protein [Vibrio parahaemolyticus]MBE3897542.1 hypothetical protein [Vibrio parahaemolyticus]
MVILLLIIILSVVSQPAFSAGSKSLIFPVFTTINKALLSDYTIFSDLSRHNIVLSYSEVNEKFLDEEVIIFNRSTIHQDEPANYTYRYIFKNIKSGCYNASDSDIVNESFMGIYINGIKYTSGDKSEPIDFNNVDDYGFESRNDILTLKNEEKIMGGIPLTCEGEVDFLVELYL